MSPKALPHPRIHHFDRAFHRYGSPFLDLAAALHRGDPRADRATEALSDFPLPEQMQILKTALAGDDLRAPASLRELIEAARIEPAWLDRCRVERGAAVLMRTGLLGGITLGAKSLVEGYCAPAGNKPLVFSGRLQERTAMRLNETARFVEALGAPGGLQHDQPGFQITLTVRLMHARVRALIQNTPRWRTDLWALPINQHDMVATIHLFSTVFLEGVRFLGMEFSELDEEDFFHLWRYVGYLIGVEEELLPRSARESRTQWEIIKFTQGPPDEDSRELTFALLEGPLRAAETEEERRRLERHTDWAKGISRALIGEELANALHLPRNVVSRFAPLLSSVLRPLNRARQAPFVDPWLESRGREYWANTIALGAGGKAIRFSLPERLRA